MSSTTIQAIFDDDDVLLSAVKDLKAANYHIEEIFTPFPVHGLEKAAGLKNTRIAITSFIYGLIGLGFATWMMNFMLPFICEVNYGLLKKQKILMLEQQMIIFY